MSDPFNDPSLSLSDPVSSAYSVTPHASNALPYITRAVYIGGTGTLVCRLDKDSSDVTFVGLPAGTILPIRAEYIRATSTATNIIALI